MYLKLISFLYHNRLKNIPNHSTYHVFAWQKWKCAIDRNASSVEISCIVVQVHFLTCLRINKNHNYLPVIKRVNCDITSLFSLSSHGKSVKVMATVINNCQQRTKVKLSNFTISSSSKSSFVKNQLFVKIQAL